RSLSEMPLERAPENLSLTEKPRKRGNPGDRQGSHKEGPCRDRNFAPQAAHLVNVLLAGHGVNHAACAEEQKRFEEGVRHQVENARGESSHPEREKHVAELADGGG